MLNGKWYVVNPSAPLAYQVMLTNLKKDWDGSAHCREDNYTVLDALLTGYTCVIFMLHKLDVLDSASHHLMEKDADLPGSPLALNAAREIVKTLTQLISLHPYPETISTFIGAFESYIAIAYLYRKVLNAHDIGAEQTDIESLERFSSYVTTVSQETSEFQPLVRALNTLTTEIKKRVDTMQLNRLQSTKGAPQKGAPQHGC